MSADQLNTSHGSLDAFGDSKNKSIISIDAVRNAAEARQKVLSTVTNSAQCEQETRRNFLKLIERELVERNEKPIVLTALQTMHTITSNVLKNPDEVKFKTVKQSNRMIKKNVIDVPGAEYPPHLSIDPWCHCEQRYLENLNRENFETSPPCFIIFFLLSQVRVTIYWLASLFQA